MSKRLDRVERADEIPTQWDALAADYYQKRTFLCHCHTYNPCRQRYYLLSENGNLLVGTVVYTLRLDLFTYLEIRSPTTMQIIGIPASVSSAGLVGDPRLHGELLARILPHEPGLVVCLNLESVPAGSPMLAGRTWPDIVLANRFGSWEGYVSALRSDYRRRLMHVLDDASGFTMQQSSCSSFTDAMHALYLNVFNRSGGKLERLDVAFFRNLPDSFRLSTYTAGGSVRGWTITVRDGRRFSFFLGGHDYTYAPRKLYPVTLLDIVKAGLASGASIVDLGQSAEIPKMRFGGEPREKIMLASHDRLLPRLMLHAGIGVLSYRKRFPEAHVFKGRAP